MLTGPIRAQVDQIWNAFWSGGWCQTDANSYQFPSNGNLSDRKKTAPLGESGGAVELEIVA